MGANIVSSDHAAAEKAKGHMAEVVATVKVILDNTQQSVDAARPGFQGDAAAAFQKAADTWDQEVVALKRLLGDIETQVGVGKAEFMSVDSTNAQGFDKIGFHTNLV
ncbi:MAG: hypothetical protein JWN03_3683 [Nocardia sp.]|uniref:WXG100 family type VII secretion target n=1 Tax=Nocardia sp. TaxID=1821 RepID=UPI0026351F94|nr:WXG100 family type VII secretion target [Nocardia sp.]MCU1643408.1 hypothetical protein [Nocardia sp.]